MSKNLRGEYFLRNGKILPRASRLLRESHDKLSFMFLIIFHGLLKLNSSEFLQFWLIVLVNDRL